VLALPEAFVSFLLYLIGFIVFIAGLAWLATVLGLSQTYIMIGAVVLLGIGIFTAAARARDRDPA
jgi:positive regulator of sigma E activity